MTHTANDTLLDEPVARGPEYRPAAAGDPPRPGTPDRTADLARIVRRALRNPGSDTPLSQAIRAAAARVVPPASATASEDESLRVRQVALRLGALLAQYGGPGPAGAAHRETVHY
jgi:hypothetical protein